MHAAVFLDRDNTLIHNDADLGEPERVRLIQGAASAIASLRGLGYRIVVVTNQGGVARGRYGEDAVEAVHRRLNELVRATSGATIDRFYYCPYHPQATLEQYRREHPWRKPLPGMLLQAAQDLHIDLSMSWMVGDQMRDVEAGAAAGCRTILLRADAEELTPLRIEQIASQQVTIERRGASGGDSGGAMPHFTARNLIEAVRVIAQQRKPETPEEVKAREREKKKWDPETVRAARGLPPVKPANAPPEARRSASPVASPHGPPELPPEVHPENSPEVSADIVPSGPPEPPVRADATRRPGQDTTGLGGTASTPADARPRPARTFRLPGDPQPPARPRGDERPPIVEPGDPRAEEKSRDRVARSTHHDASIEPAGDHRGNGATVPACPEDEASVPTPEATATRLAADNSSLSPAPSDAGGAPAAPPSTRTGRDPEESFGGGDRAVLNQILQEIRHQRSNREDFGAVKIAAIVLQMIAAVCLLGGLLMGREDLGLFARWLGTALIFQLMTLAALLLNR